MKKALGLGFSMEIDSDWMLGSAKDFKQKKKEMSVGTMPISMYTCIYMCVLTVGAKLDGARLGETVGFVLGSADGFGYV